MIQIGNNFHIQRGEIWSIDASIINEKTGVPFVLMKGWQNPYLVITITNSRYEQSGDFRRTYWLDLSKYWAEKQDGTMELVDRRTFISSEALPLDAEDISEAILRYGVEQGGRMVFDKNSDFDIKNYLFVLDPNKDGNYIYKYVKDYVSDQMLGTGSAEDPFQIKTVDHFYQITSDRCYVLMNDLDFDGKTFTPIAGVTNVTFDGNGYAIKNINHTYSAKGQAGIFAEFSGTIKNLLLLDCAFRNSFGKNGEISALIGNIIGATTLTNIYSNTVLEATRGTNFVAALVVRGPDAAYTLEMSNIQVDGRTTIADMSDDSMDKGYGFAGGLVGNVKNDGTTTINNVLITGELITEDALNTATNGNASIFCEQVNSGTIKVTNSFVQTGSVVRGGKKQTEVYIRNAGSYTKTNSGFLDITKDSLIAANAGYDFEGEDAVWATAADGSVVLKLLADYVPTAEEEQQWESYDFRFIKRFDTKDWIEQDYLFDVKVVTGESVIEHIYNECSVQEIDTKPLPWSDEDVRLYLDLLDPGIRDSLNEIYESGVPLMPSYDTRIVISQPTKLFVGANIQGGGK